MSELEFDFTAMDRQGRKVRGRLVAASVKAVHADLRGRGLTPIALKAARGGRLINFGDAVSPAALAEALRAWGMLLAAGAPLITSLRMVREQAQGRAVQRLCLQLEEDISAGRQVAPSLAAILGTRAAFVPGIVAAGEASGGLGAAFEEAADQIEQNLKLREELWGALSYPVFILVASVAAILVLLLLVVPSIAPLVATEGAKAPIVLRVMIAASSTLKLLGPFVLVLAGILAMTVVAGARFGFLRARSDALILDGPFRNLARSIILGRFSTVLGHLLQSGVPSPAAFKIAIQGLSNLSARDRIEAASQKIFDGVRVSAALGSCRGFPSAIVRLASIGEESGRLGEMLKHGGQLEQRHAVRQLHQIGRWLAPAMIVVLGVLIGGVMGGLLSGVASLGDAVLDGA